jgi:hypothetical protein
VPPPKFQDSDLRRPIVAWFSGSQARLTCAPLSHPDNITHAHLPATRHWLALRIGQCIFCAYFFSLCPESQERMIRLDQFAGSELARGHKLRGAGLRPDPMSSSLYSTPTATSGAALVCAGDRKAPHTHPVPTPREREATMHHADEQSPPPPSPLAASQRTGRPKLSRARRKLIGATHRFGLLKYPQIFIHYLQCIGEQYSATGQSRVIYFSIDDMASIRDWKAIPATLDIDQPGPAHGFFHKRDRGPST